MQSHPDRQPLQSLSESNLKKFDESRREEDGIEVDKHSKWHEGKPKEDIDVGRKMVYIEVLEKSREGPSAGESWLTDNKEADQTGPSREGAVELGDLVGEDPLTPQIYEEFLQCNSEYALSDKDESDKISSDGEFNDADRIDVFDEDDSYINVIERERDIIYNN